MNCLNNIVGVRCLGDSSSSGLYVEDLEGINVKTASQIADVRYQSGLDLIKKKKEFAIKAIANDIQGAFLPYFRMNSLIDELVVGKFKDTTLTTSPLKRGVEIKTRNSRLLRIQIQTVEIKILEAALTSYLKIIDGLDEKLVEFTTDADGKALIDLNYISKTNQIFIVLEDPLITPFDGQLKSGCHCYSKSSEFLTGRGYKDGQTASSTFGLSVQSLAVCDQEQFVCLLAPRLGFAILYKTGIEIVKEWIASDRLNPVTMIDDGTEDFLLSEFESQYKNQLKILIESLPDFFIRLDEICVVCSGNTYVEAVP